MGAASQHDAVAARTELVPRHALERAGLAARSDLETPAWQELYSRLERDQDAFLAREDAFRSPEYAWPRDALRNWSRRWEYPTVYHWAAEWRARWDERRRPALLDVGSGVTFFPFALAKLDIDVVCTDVDPVCERDLGRAAGVVDAAPGRVRAIRTAPYRLPFDDASVDGVCCVSVLEHVDDPPRLLAEFERVLRPGAPLFLTLDVDLREEGWALGAADFAALRQDLLERFDLLYTEATIHPADILSSDTAPGGYGSLSVPAAGWFHAKQRVLKPLLRPLIYKRPYQWPPMHLGIAAFPLVRRQPS